jgi:hypothetical protein
VADWLAVCGEILNKKYPNPITTKTIITMVMTFFMYMFSFKKYLFSFFTQPTSRDLKSTNLDPASCLTDRWASAG